MLRAPLVATSLGVSDHSLEVKYIVVGGKLESKAVLEVGLNGVVGRSGRRPEAAWRQSGPLTGAAPLPGAAPPTVAAPPKGAMSAKVGWPLLSSAHVVVTLSWYDGGTNAVVGAGGVP